MNLLRSSWTDSHEFGVFFNDKETLAEIRAYVFDVLVALGKDVAKPSVAVSEAKKKVSRRKSPVNRKSETAGICIRCAASIALNPDYPLCEECYEIWARYGDEEYPEEYCHACGEDRSVSYGRPLCKTCWRKIA
jgi:hypothetical protein